ncbi:hypothetical protein WICPIJ_000976 [Wickerhamomyces pijperi]|uniref:Uncharacterized protein n=1 Tax=Wickerhamomyces pijperi TaxID=599730 RepID=A0A9P8TR29_WICPI|nr:hypothetical protein WICPIJ_000976 [Wickerhamomyces pijperi]
MRFGQFVKNDVFGPQRFEMDKQDVVQQNSSSSCGNNFVSLNSKYDSRALGHPRFIDCSTSKETKPNQSFLHRCLWDSTVKFSKLSGSRYSPILTAMCTIIPKKTCESDPSAESFSSGEYWSNSFKNMANWTTFKLDFLINWPLSLLLFMYCFTHRTSSSEISLLGSSNKRILLMSSAT